MITATLLAALTLAAAPGAPAKLLVLEPEVVKVDDDDARVLQRLLVQELGRAEGLEVVGSGELQKLADLSATQLSAGCDGDACLAEIAEAMGAGLVVFSEVGRLGGRTLWQLGLWDQASGQILSRATIEDATVDGLSQKVDDAVVALLGPLADRGVRYEPASTGGSPLVPIGGVVAGVGGLALVGGAVGLVVGGIVVGDPSFDTGLRRTMQGAGPALVVTTVVGAVVGVVGAGVLVAGLVGGVGE